MKKSIFLLLYTAAVSILFSSCKTESAFYVSYEMASHDRNARIEPRSLKCEMDSIVVEFTPKKGFIVRNNSDYAMIIDLYNSTNALDGVSVRFSNCETTTIYTTNTTTTSNSRGVTTNLGGIARALGVGGAVGAIASGVNVGGGSTNANTSSTTQAVTQTEERYIVIAPHAYQALGHVAGDYIFATGTKRSLAAQGPGFIDYNNLKPFVGEYYNFRPRNLMENYSSQKNVDLEINEDDRVEMSFTLYYGFENEENFHYKYLVIYPYSVYFQKESGPMNSTYDVFKQEFKIPKKKNMIKFLYSKMYATFGGTEEDHWYSGY